jgi:hypothetical protein
MKKLMLIAVAMLLTTSVVAATYSNPVGFVKLSLVNGYAMVTVPMLADDMALNDDDPAVTCIGEMLGENLTGSTNPTTAATIYKYTGAGFESAWLVDFPGNPLDGKWMGATGPSTMITDGQTGYYVQNSGVADAVILGDVNVADTTDISLVAGYNLIAYPYPVTLAVNGGNFVSLTDGATGSTNPTTADTVYKYTGAGFESAWLVDFPGNPLHDNWMGATGPSTMSLDPGVGFYYMALNPFTWTVERPFTVN